MLNESKVTHNDDNVNGNQSENDDLKVENATGNPPEKPTPLSVIAENIPESLKKISQWVLWKYALKEDKWTKPPYQVSGQPAKSTDPQTWTDFEAAHNAYKTGNFDGIGFVVADNGIAGFDFDHCLDIAGNITDPKVDGFLKALDSYTEKSPSGTGLRVFAIGNLPEGGRKKGDYECYSSGRYLTLTGHSFKGFSGNVEHRGAQITEVHKLIFDKPVKSDKPEKKTEKPNGSFSEKKIDSLLKKAFASKNGDKIRGLYDGKWEECGYSSQSNADFALCCHFAFWLDCDPAAIDSAFRKSKLFRDKWDEKHGAQTYSEMTIAKAIAGCEQTYQDNAQEKKPPVSSALIDIGKRADLFFNNDEPYATVSVNGHYETHALKSRAFRSYLNNSFYEENGYAVNRDGISQAIDNLEAMARKNGEKPVFTRIARIDDTIYIDLCNPEYEVVRITGAGWEVVKEPSVRFIRGTGADPLPKPERTGTGFDDLKKLMNCKADEDFCMLTGFLIGCFSFGNPYPILCLQGEARSGKSTKTKMIKRLTDPNKADLRALPKEMRDLMISARHNHTLAYDNLSGMPQWLSDSFCRLSTGGGFAIRAHYADSEEIIFDAKRPLILNGIEDIAQKTDLADRSISVTLEAMDESTRSEEGIMWSEFDRMRPGILGAVFDAVSESLKNLNNTVLTEKNVRMLDFAKWIIAAEPALPFESGFFMKAYAGNRESLIESALQDNPVADAIMKFMENTEKWEGTASELLAKLRELIGESASLPKKANGFSSKIRHVIPFLRETGIEITIPQGKERRNGKIIKIIYITKKVKNIGNIGNTSLCESEESGKTVSYDVADSVADNDIVADDDRQHEKHRQQIPGVLPIKKSDVADTPKSSATQKDDKNQDVINVADVADKSRLLSGSRCCECEKTDPVYSDFCRWNEGGLIISWSKCQGKFFKPKNCSEVYK